LESSTSQHSAIPVKTLLVSDRGQVTLPKRLRDRLAITPGSALIAEERDGALVLRPAAVTPLRVYSDEEIEEWLREDRVTPAERRRLLKKARGR
jgi:antitoxin PrlF